MKKTFELHPERNFYSIPELEKRLKFKFIAKNSFETLNEQKVVKAKGIEKWENNEISSEEQENGKNFKDKIETAYIPSVSIRWVNKEVGYGLFVEEDLPLGCYVGEYTGIVRQNNRRYFEPLNNYCYKYPVPDDIGRSYVIDATQGNLTRFINHSFEPNLKPTYAFFNGFFHLIFLVINPIKKGSQLTYNYGKNYWYIRNQPFNLKNS